MPPVTLTAAMPCSAPSCAPAPAVAPVADRPEVAPVGGRGSRPAATGSAASTAEVAATVSEPAGRPRLRLISSPATAETVHGFGGPASCSCRACTMARHPAAMPRLTVVR